MKQLVEKITREEIYKLFKARWSPKVERLSFGLKTNVSICLYAGSFIDLFMSKEWKSSNHGFFHYFNIYILCKTLKASLTHMRSLMESSKELYYWAATGDQKLGTHACFSVVNIFI